MVIVPIKPLIYVAGPYTTPDPVVNTRNAIETGMTLWKHGFAPIIPHLSLLAHIVCPMPIEEWYELDIQVLHRCDALYRMPGGSVGADMEVDYAESHAIPWFVDLNLLYQYFESNLNR